MAENKWNCKMNCIPLQSEGKPQEKAALEKAIRDCLLSDVFAYTESVGCCTLEKIPKDAFVLPDDAEAFEGHVFDGTTDVRWVKSADGWRAWKTTESTGTGFAATDRSYYLLGEYDKEETSKLKATEITAFTEGRYPGKVFIYPVSGATEHDRAYIKVVEYRRCKPASWSENNETLAAELDAPLLCGHRFVAVKVGRE